MLSSRLLAATCAVALLSVAAPAGGQSVDDGPSDRSLILVGSAMAVPAYFLGVTIHEGSHALTARAFGARITAFHVLPGFHPRTGAFYFGYTSYRGALTRNQKALFYAAPRLVDLVVLGGYSAMVGLDALPGDEWAQLGLVVFATSAWVDFSKDVFRFSAFNDVPRFYRLYDLDGLWETLPYRLIHLALIAGTGYAVARGYVELFDDGDEAVTAPIYLPIYTGTF